MGGGFDLSPTERAENPGAVLFSAALPQRNGHFCCRTPPTRSAENLGAVLSSVALPQRNGHFVAVVAEDQIFQ